MPDRYAAMSPFEFFAELYALYYDLDDPQRKNIPKDVSDWPGARIGVAETSQPARPSLMPAHRGTKKNTHQKKKRR